MQLHYDDETEAFRAELRAWLAANQPTLEEMRAAPMASSAHLPGWSRRWQRLLFDAGLLVPGWPRELGGRSLPPVQQLVYHEEMAKIQETVGAARFEAGKFEEAATLLKDLVLAEEFVAGQELTAGFVGEQALPLIRIEAPEGRYDYQSKYFSDETRYFCPCGLSPEEERGIQDLVMRSAAALDCSGWGRADLIRRVDGSICLLEMNTSPGMTGHSLVPMAAKVAGMDFQQLVLRILELAHVG